MKIIKKIIGYIRKLFNLYEDDKYKDYIRNYREKWKNDSNNMQ